MKVKVIYSKTALIETVKYISKHNSFYIGKDDYIKKRILDLIDEIVNYFPKYPIISTMGFMVAIDYFEPEGIDYDENVIKVDIYVDPTIDKSDYKFVSKYKKIKGGEKK